MAAFGSKGDDIAESREHPIRHRVFSQEPYPAGNANGNPPTPPAAFARSDKGVECGRPEQHQWCVGRDNKGRDRRSRQAGIGEARPQPDAAVVEASADRINKDGRAGVQQRRREPDRELALAKNAGRQRDQPGYERRLRIIAECGMLGPKPVLRFVRIKVGRLDNQPQQPQTGDREHPRQHQNGGRRAAQREPKCGHRAAWFALADRHA